MAGASNHSGLIPGGHTITQMECRAANIQRVRELLLEKSMMSTELAAIVGVPVSTMNGYLYHLADMGEARSVACDDKRKKVWVADERCIEIAADKARAEHANRARIVKAEQVGMPRHWMDVALFGPAQAAA